MADFNLRAAEYLESYMECNVINPIVGGGGCAEIYVADTSDLGDMIELEIDERIDCARLIWQQIEELE